MIIWGGYNGSTLNDGAVYDPVGNSWTRMAGNGAPSPRGLLAAIWTGTAMLVWGGTDGPHFFNDGGLYDPISNTWLPTTTTGSAPAARGDFSSVWTGSTMIVWGGAQTGFQPLPWFNDTFIYTPPTSRTLYLYQRP
jgi:hypothetical protein